MTIWHWLIVLSVVILVFGTRKLASLGDDSKNAAHTPVYSAEATNGTEAEFIRDGLPRRPSLVIVIAFALLLCAGAWWLTR
jgi:TatA/E family protein of Tat protein translocase